MLKPEAPGDCLGRLLETGSLLPASAVSDLWPSLLLHLIQVDDLSRGITWHFFLKPLSTSPNIVPILDGQTSVTVVHLLLLHFHISSSLISIGHLLLNHPEKSWGRPASQLVVGRVYSSFSQGYEFGED